MSNWLIYQGDGKPHEGITGLRRPPPWRTFDPVAGSPSADLSHEGWTETDLARGRSYRATAKMLNAINAAIYLRRPLLVTGKPGVGKSTLAYSLAYESGCPRCCAGPLPAVRCLRTVFTATTPSVGSRPWT